MAKLVRPAKNRTRNVQFVMTAIVRTQMPSFFAMVAILLFIKNVMECHSSPKANGIAGSASFLARTTL
jgi:hypothetical protein